MTQYPNEKDPSSDWVHAAQNPSYAYTSRDGAPAATSSYAHPPPQGYYPPPAGPPPTYGYAVGHPESRPTYDHRVPHETVLAPPPNLNNVIYSPPDPVAPSSSSSSQDGNQGGSAMSLGAFFGNKGTPEMWNRPAPPQLPYNAFPPMCLISNGKDLSGGFPELPPPCPQNPHPFATHDITEEDWKRYVRPGV